MDTRTGIIDAKIARLSFNWKGVTMYLPKITITKDLRRVADEHISKSKCEQEIRATSPTQLDDWNPSWDDDDDDDVYWLASYGSLSGNDIEIGAIKIEIEESMTNDNEQNECKSLTDSANNKLDSDPAEAKVTKLSQMEILKRKLKSNQPFQNLKAFNELAQAPSRSCEKCGETYNNFYAHKQTCTHQRINRIGPAYPVRKIETTEEANEDLTCKDCGKVFSKKLHLTLHLKIHARMGNGSVQPKVLPFICSVCSLRFATNNDLVKHFKLKHYGDYITQLITPNLASQANDNTPNTWVLNLGNDPITCATCLQIFCSVEELQQHEIVHTRAPLTCLICGENFLSASALMTHSLTHDEHEKAESKFGCSRCGRRFGRQNQLNFHTKFCKTSKQIQSAKSSSSSFNKSTISVSKPSILEESHCDNVNIQENISTLAPVVVDDSQAKMKFECSECGRTFKQRHYLSFHQRSHTKVCKNCGLQMTDKDFAIHSQQCCSPVPTPIISNEEEPRNVVTQSKKKIFFACEICGELFDDDRKLAEHCLVHDFSIEDMIAEDDFESKLPYICEYAVCKTRFSDKLDLQCHVDQVHMVKDSSTQANTSVTVKSEKISPLSCPKYFYINDKNRQLPVPYVLICKEMKRAAESKLVKFPIEQSPKPGRKATIYPKYTGPPPIILKRPSIIIRGKKPRDDIPFQNFYICEFCNKKIKNRNIFFSHLAQHNREANHKCNICDRKFFTEKLLSKHKKRHEDPSYQPRAGRSPALPYEDIYACDQCEPPKKFTRRQAFINHLFYHKQRLSTKFQCRQCLRNFTSKQSLIQHMPRHANPNFRGRLNIPVQDVYTCTMCKKGKRFTNRQRFILHVRYHNLEHNYACSLCPRRFKLEQNLKLHVDSHSRVKLFECVSCLKKFTAKASLDMHVEKFCKKVPCQYRCKYCEDAFHSVKRLQTHHIRWHSAETAIERKYSCPHCGRSFDTFKKRKQHVDKLHSSFNAPSLLSSKKSTLPEACSYEDTSPKADWSHDEGNDEYIDVSKMLETNICETQENIVPSPKKASNVKKNKSRPICFCGAVKKYKTQKFCDRPTKCLCVQAKHNCCSDCRCQDSCLNQSDSEVQQMQTFKDGKDYMIHQESLEICATFGNAQQIHVSENSTPQITTDAELDNSVEKNISTLSTIRYNGYGRSEYISVDCNEVDESIRELTFSGYVEGDEADPLADTDPLDSQDSIEALDLDAETASQAPPSNSNIENPIISTTNENSRAEAMSLALSNINYQNEPTFLNCEFCSFSNFQLMPAYISHVLYHGDGTSSFTCPICKQKINTIRSYITHLDHHNNGVVFNCKKCSSKFKSSNDMDMHQKVHHSKPLECGVCLMKFDSTHSLMIHWSKQHPTCQCGLCMVKFFSYDNLTRHMKSLHSPYDCAFCNIRIEKVEELVDHVIKNHYTFENIRSTPMLSENTCDFCGDKFISLEDRDWHVKNLHGNEMETNSMEQVQNQSHCCYICMDTFMTIEDLNEHTLMVHIAPSNTTAGNEVDNRRNDTQGVNLEAVEAFSCNKCGLSFGSKVSLSYHMRNKHSMCSSCKCLFDTQEELQIHWKTTSCVVYECVFCHQNFNIKRYLTNHLRKKHNHTSADKQGKDKGSVLQQMLQQSSDEVFYPFSNSNQMEDSFTTPVIIASTSLNPQVGKQKQSYIEEITID